MYNITFQLYGNRGTMSYCNKSKIRVHQIWLNVVGFYSIVPLDRREHLVLNTSLLAWRENRQSLRQRRGGGTMDPSLAAQGAIQSFLQLHTNSLLWKKKRWRTNIRKTAPCCVQICNTIKRVKRGKKDWIEIDSCRSAGVIEKIAERCLLDQVLCLTDIATGRWKNEKYAQCILSDTATYFTRPLKTASNFGFIRIKVSRLTPWRADMLHERSVRGIAYRESMLPGSAKPYPTSIEMSVAQYIYIIYCIWDALSVNVQS